MAMFLSQGILAQIRNHEAVQSQMWILMNILYGLRAKAEFKNIEGTFPNASKRVSTFIVLVQWLNNVLSTLKSPGVATVITFFNSLRM